MVDPGWFYKDRWVAQHHNVKKKFTQLISSIKPARILEIGTYNGGLTLILQDILFECNLINTTIRTYDINAVTNLNNIEVCTKNLFNDDYSNFLNVQSFEEVNNFINSPGHSLILCDGGSKISEYKLLCPISIHHGIKINDIIMAHDYAPNEIYFNLYMKDKIWNWLEIQDIDIQKCYKDYFLSKFMYDEFLSIGWLCTIKKEII